MFSIRQKKFLKKEAKKFKKNNVIDVWKSQKNNSYLNK